MITPKEIEMKEFSRTKVGGYNPDEVEDFLNRILEDYSALIEERDALNKRVAYLNDKIERSRDDQDKMRSAVVTNQKSYDDMMGSAKKKADKIVSDAQDYAKRLIETAKEEADHQQQVKTQLTAEVESFKSRLLSIYENHVKLISSIPVFKKDDEEYESGALEMLKVATADVATSLSSYSEDPIDTGDFKEAEDEDDDLDIPNDSTIIMPSVHAEKQSDSSRLRRPAKMQNDDFDLDDDDDDDIDDTSANDKQIKGLFSSEKKKKSLFGSGN
ncbi:MAG: DivIVA domain-containing protein [Clostridia bacterium]|nr:DivIVA domain-containing protein [Clostridia bacterium]